MALFFLHPNFQQRFCNGRRQALVLRAAARGHELRQVKSMHLAGLGQRDHLGQQVRIAAHRGKANVRAQPGLQTVLNRTHCLVE